MELFRPVAVNFTNPREKKEGLFMVLGEKTSHFFTEYVISFLYLVSDILYWSIKDLFSRKHRRKGEVINQAISIGVNALPIVMAMAFIIGLVLALQSSFQLRNFGANVYIVDLTVIAMMAEMGPLITAIMVAGRSGSSIAAEIATMKVTAETDALQTMGLNPIRFVVIPKIYGSLITLPFLTILACMAGIIGGAVAANFYLDITPEIFFNRMPLVLYQKDILTGIFKSLCFAFIIVITGTFFGFKVKEGAEGVGKSTTSAVVAAIALVIIADLVLGILFY
jgi:phospholipid/cholesterol/gamma-HCH transport system permease protein